MKLVATIAAIAALGLAACGEKPATTDGAAATPAAAEPAAPVAAPAAAVIEGPAAGKWKLTMTAMGQSLPPQEICYEKQTSMEEAQKTQQQAGMTCLEQNYRREGASYLGHSVCEIDMAGKKTKVTTDLTVAGDFNTAYTMEMTTKMDPPPMAGMEETKTSIAAERLGDC